MIFVTHSTSAQQAKDYHTRALERSDYYTQDAAEMKGRWHGLGAELLDLQGDIGKKEYFALCDNLNPQTGKQLTTRTVADRRVSYDFTFTAPKSVSLAYEVGGDEQVLNAFRDAVRDTMGEMEAAMKTRVRAKGANEDRVTSNLVWAEYIHRTTRPVDNIPDPALHCHAVAFNCSYDHVENKWKAGQFSDLVRDKGYYQAAFSSRLSEHLSALGYGIERDGNSFRLSGISRSTVEKFSRRTQIIEAEAQRLGIKDAKTKGELGRRTREKKGENPRSMSELRQEWKRWLTDAERDDIAGLKTDHKTQTLNAREAVDHALLHSFERSSVVTEKELLKTALIQSYGNASVGKVKKEMPRDNVVLKDVAGQRYATTKEVCREEISMLAFARDGQGRHRKLGGSNSPELDEQLSPEQREAALQILNSRDRVTGLIGRAGAGKTRMMQSTVKAIEASGKKVLAFAPSAKSSRGVLREEGFSNADTVKKLLTDGDLQRSLQGQVVWIEEAGLLSAKDLKGVFDVAKQREARVILSGDENQHSAVERGDGLRILRRDIGARFAELKDVRRQTNDAYREAVVAISQGEAVARDGRTQLAHGIEKLDKMGAIVEVEGEARYRHLAADYIASTSDLNKHGELKTALVISPTHAEGEKVSNAIREGLKSSGVITGRERDFISLKSLSLTEAQRADPHSYRVGDVIQFVQNTKGGYRRGEQLKVREAGPGGVTVAREDGRTEQLPLSEAARFQAYEARSISLAAGDRVRITQNGFSRETRRGARTGKSRLNNGDMYEVAGFERNGDIRFKNGFMVPKTYGGLSHGYVLTSHSAQGATVDKVLIALGSESFSAANRQQLYVSASRGREAIRIYTDQKAEMMEAVKANSVRLSATELLEGKAPVRRQSSTMQRIFKAREINRAYQAVKERVTAWTPPARQKEVSRGL